ncbi:MAG: hypothetical protein NTV49_15960 [Kiritimatiellaeota bacterium]|nr:hypothetical protein [Kiritimatiellota bacterium]
MMVRRGKRPAAETYAGEELAWRSFKRFFDQAAQSGFGTFHDFDFFGGQAVKVIDEAINLLVGGSNLALQRGLLLRRPRGSELPVQGQHLLHQLHHPVMRRSIGYAGKIYPPDGKLTDELRKITEVSPAHGGTYAFKIKIKQRTVQQGESGSIMPRL